MTRPRPRRRSALRLAVLLGLVLGTTAAASPAEAHLDYCGHGTHFDVRHPQYRMEFLGQFDRRGRHYHRVLFHRQLLGSEDWTTTFRCDHTG